MKPMEFPEFKVKRHWWMWVLGIFGNLLAARGFQAGIYILFYVVIIIDIVIILPEAFQFKYIVTDREVIVKRLLYPDITIPFIAITAVEHAALLTFGGFALHIMESSLGACKITYVKGRKHRHYAAVICPKDEKQFIRELEARIDPKVILIDNTESAFKKKKDEN